MTLPESTRLLRTNELPPIGTRVYVPENTAAFVGERPAPGWQRVLATAERESTIGVKDTDGYTSWVLSHNLLVEDKTRRLAVGDTVIVNAPGEKYHGMIGTLAEDDGTPMPYWVRFERGAEWFYPSQVRLVPDEATPAPDLVSVRHEVTVTIERPATAGQLAAGAAAIDPDWPVTVHVHPDRIEFYAHHEEPRE